LTTATAAGLSVSEVVFILDEIFYMIKIADFRAKENTRAAVSGKGAECTEKLWDGALSLVQAGETEKRVRA